MASVRIRMNHPIETVLLFFGICFDRKEANLPEDMATWINPLGSLNTRSMRIASRSVLMEI